MCSDGKGERQWSLRCFQQLRFYPKVIESRKWEEIPSSSQIVPGSLSAAEGPLTALHNAAHLYRDQANPLFGMQRRV